MLYCIIAEDVPDSLNQRLAARPAHLQRLQALQAAGCLLIAGPMPAIDSDDPGTNGYTGSLIVAEFPSLDAAQVWANADPYLQAGVYKHIIVKPFKLVLPK
ncbi:MAG: hypothetical protein CTY22_10650 [Methylomonas sp.]|nr:MAG: hypothetical protein CTY23_12110 [Methylomonas sp.]PPD24780.1 MAG: hypothetical protein CTY22_10650 [Methylomonas sp.]PPD33479.1 MAG: hypothetical protein CTY21_10630 [Methylomonas sp.]PPD54883.1 MAG: hypothetical protein CTY11_02700 [Methylomonas sp.]